MRRHAGQITDIEADSAPGAPLYAPAPVWLPSHFLTPKHPKQNGESARGLPVFLCSNLFLTVRFTLMQVHEGEPFGVRQLLLPLLRFMPLP